MTILENFPHRATLSRSRYKQDGYGADQRVLVPLATNRKCWCQNASQSEIAQFQKMDERITHRISFTSDPGLRPGDYIVLTEGAFIGAEMRYVASTERTAGFGIAWTVYVEQQNNKTAETF